ncbi:MAG: type II toxin-antitoxin system HipA family toxin [Thiopseudomonas sp.]
MISKLKVYYNGWGEHWHWASLWLTDPRTQNIAFEYTPEAINKGLELSPLNLPTSQPIAQGFPGYQDHLPGIIADCLPDGWGRLLMDRWFRQQGLALHQISALDRLTYLGGNAMGAFSFEPEQSIGDNDAQALSLTTLAQESQKILHDQASDLLNQLVLMGGSPHGARPKVLVYRSADGQSYSNIDFAGATAWLVKFPAQNEKAEVSALEHIYAHCAKLCGLQMELTEYFDLGNNLSAFGSQRFDRQQGMRVPMHTLAGYLHDNFRIPACDYDTLVRATAHITGNNHHEIEKAFRLAVFNVVFNNHDDHSKNFSFLLNQQQQWQLSPAYDLTFNEGPNGYHQMSVMGEALTVEKKHLLELAKVAGITKHQAQAIIQHTCDIAQRLTSISQELLPDTVSQTTLNYIQTILHRRVKQVS